MLVRHVIQRELLAAARRSTTFRLRQTAALIPVAIAAYVLIAGLILRNSRTTGAELFTAIAGFAFLFSLGAGAFFTADALSHEVRQGTIGLLYLTPLRSWEIVAGKLIAHGSAAAGGLLAAIPILSLAWIMGGVTIQEYSRMALVLMNTLFFSLAVGLATNPRSSSPAEAALRALLMIAAATILPLVIAVLLHQVFPAISTALLSVPSPWTAFRGARSGAFAADPGQFWSSLVVIHVCGWILFFIASRRLARNWRDADHGAGTRSTTHVRLREGCLDSNPVGALVVGDVWAVRAAWWSAIISLVLVVAQMLAPNLGSFLGLPGMGLGISLIPMKLALAWVACDFVVTARRNGFLELLLTTRLTDFEIVRGVIHSVRQVFIGPVVLLASGTLLTLGGFIWQTSQSLVGGAPMAVVYGLHSAFAAATFIVDCAALMWVGFWLSLTESRPGWAFAKTALRVIVLPGLAFCVPNILINGLQLAWARSKFYLNLRTILERSRRNSTC